MKKGFLVRSVFSVLVSYLVSLAFMVLFALLCVNMNSTEGVPEISGMSALILGALVCGLVSRRLCDGPLSGVFSGALYVALPLLVGLFSGSGASFSWPVRIGIFSVCLLAVFGISALPKSSTHRKNSAKRRKNLLSKYMENR